MININDNIQLGREGGRVLKKRNQKLKLIKKERKYSSFLFNIYPDRNNSKKVKIPNGLYNKYPDTI